MRVWNCLISDPYFMKSRSRRMILLPFTRPRPLVVIDENVAVKDKAHSMVGVHYPPLEKGMVVSIVGTFNGIVLLAITDYYKSLRCQLVLYNPLTCASNKLLVMDPLYQTLFVFGFADLKIFRFEVFNDSMCKCDVFDLKTSSWSSRPLYLKRDFRFEGDAGMFQNGFLYWATNFGILDLDVKEMVFSRIEHPDGLKYAVPLLGFVDGCLCVVNTIGATRFDLWVRKEQGVWLKARSFAIPLEACYFSDCCPVCILGNEKILLTTRTMGLFIYDTSNDTFKPLDGLTTGEYFKPTPSIFCFKDIRAIEYVESLVLPSHTCSSLLEKKHTCHLQGRFEVNQHNFDKMSCYVKL